MRLYDHHDTMSVHALLGLRVYIGGLEFGKLSASTEGDSPATFTEF
jgi:hypothetical protein